MDQLHNTLVVAGGASKCIASVGAIYYLNEMKHLDFIENYAGTSAGGLICYLMCIGYSPFEIIHFLCKSNFIDEFQTLSLASLLEQKGLFNYYIIQEYLEKLTINKIGFIPTFRDLKIKFGKNLTVVAYNLTKNTVEYINDRNNPDMSCLTALRMTTNVPLLFDRFFYNNCEYLDGGLIDNFPICYYGSKEHKIIGIDINPNSTPSPKKQGYIPYLLQLAMIPCAFFNTQRKIPEAVIVNIHTDATSFDFNLSITKRLDIFSKGYQTAKLLFEPPLKEEVKKDERKDEKKEEEIKEDSTKKTHRAWDS